jgi:predicted nuclease of predicted toxin-antitoxin system
VRQKRESLPEVRLLFDENISVRLVQALADVFPGSSHVNLDQLQRSDDFTIWQHARDNGFVLVTQDSDFNDLAQVRGVPPKIVWLRCGNQKTSTIETIMRKNVAAITAFYADVDAACLELY